MKHGVIRYLILTVGVVAGCIAPSQGRRDKGPGSTVVLPGAIPLFPAYLCDEAGDFCLPPPGRTYGLTPEPPDRPLTPPTTMWIHRVTREIPGASREEVADLVRKLGFGQNIPKEWPLQEPVSFRDSHGEFSIGRSPSTSFLFYAPEWHSVNKINSLPDYERLKPRRMLTADESYAVGRKALAELGILPSNLEPKWHDHNNLIGMLEKEEKVVLDHFFYCGAVIEGFPVRNENLYLNFSVMYTGKFGKVEVNWRDTERYAFVKIKTPEEAFVDLNLGYAQPLPETLVGGKAKPVGCIYWPERRGSRFIHLVYFFRVSKDGHEDDFLVPAIKAEYFENPKRQVVTRRMLEAADKIKQWELKQKPPSEGKGPK